MSLLKMLKRNAEIAPQRYGAVFKSLNLMKETNPLKHFGIATKFVQLYKNLLAKLECLKNVQPNKL